MNIPEKGSHPSIDPCRKDVICILLMMAHQPRAETTVLFSKSCFRFVHSWKQRQWWGYLLENSHPAHQEYISTLFSPQSHFFSNWMQVFSPQKSKSKPSNTTPRKLCFVLYHMPKDTILFLKKNHTWEFEIAFYKDMRCFSYYRFAWITTCI